MASVRAGKSGRSLRARWTLAGGAAAAEIFDALREGGVELRGVEELEEGALGVDTGDYGAGGEFFAAGEDEAGDCTVFDADVADFGVGADFGAGCARGFCEGAGEGAEASVGEGSGTDWMRIGCGAKKKDCCGACGPRAERGAEDTAGGDYGAQEFRVEKFGYEIGSGHGAPTDEIEHAFLAEAANAASGLEKISSRIFGRGRIDGVE